MHCQRNEVGRCRVHGSQWLLGECGARRMAELVVQERAFQYRQYGDNRDLEDGTGSTAEWLYPVSTANAEYLEMALREDYDAHEKPTWARLVREEVAEAMMEDDPEQQVGELLQVAALCVSWSEKLAERGMTLRERFCAAFNPNLADELDATARHYRTPSKEGSDPFSWTLAVLIGLNLPVRSRGWLSPSVRDWIKAEANLAEYDGDIEYRALFEGRYNEYV